MHKEARAERESNMGIMISEFREMTIPDEVGSDDEADEVVRQRDVHTDNARSWGMTDDQIVEQSSGENQRAEQIVTEATAAVSNNSTNSTIPPLADDQCSWCGFTGHTRKSKTKCPLHANYTGPLEKGKTVTPDWVSLPRSAYLKKVGQPRGAAVGRRVRNPTENQRVPTSVLSAPTCANWHSTHWTEGAGALNDFDPHVSTAPRLTTINPDLGWTVDTQPEELFEAFFPVAFQKNMIKWANQTAADRGAGRYWGWG